MKKLRISIMAAGLIAVFVLPAAAMHHEVKIAKKAGVGRYLTDTEGRTLYRFKKDSVGHSACSGGCVNNWPLFYRQQVAPPTGLSDADFGTIMRDDGAMQTTFRGYPLYYFKGDLKPGDTRGQGVLDLWYVVDPGNFPPKMH